MRADFLKAEIRRRQEEMKKGFPVSAVKSNINGEVFLCQSDKEQLNRIEAMLVELLGKQS